MAQGIVHSVQLGLTLQPQPANGISASSGKGSSSHSVAAVNIGGPAHTHKFVVGETIFQIDGVPVRSVSTEKLCNLLNGEEGTFVSIIVGTEGAPPRSALLQREGAAPCQALSSVPVGNDVVTTSKKTPNNMTPSERKSIQEDGHGNTTPPFKQPGVKEAGDEPSEERVEMARSDSMWSVPTKDLPSDGPSVTDTTAHKTRLKVFETIWSKPSTLILGAISLGCAAIGVVSLLYDEKGDKGQPEEWSKYSWWVQGGGLSALLFVSFLDCWAAGLPIAMTLELPLLCGATVLHWVLSERFGPRIVWLGIIGAWSFWRVFYSLVKFHHPISKLHRAVEAEHERKAHLMDIETVQALGEALEFERSAHDLDLKALHAAEEALAHANHLLRSASATTSLQVQSKFPPSSELRSRVLRQLDEQQELIAALSSQVHGDKVRERRAGAVEGSSIGPSSRAHIPPPGMNFQRPAVP